jgi:hypothetical protein
MLEWRQQMIEDNRRRRDELAAESAERMARIERGEYEYAPPKPTGIIHKTHHNAPADEANRPELAGWTDAEWQAALLSTVEQMIDRKVEIARHELIDNIGTEMGLILAEEDKRIAGLIDGVRVEMVRTVAEVADLNRKLMENASGVNTRTAADTDRLIKKLGAISKSMASLDAKVTDMTGNASNVRKLHG